MNQYKKKGSNIIISRYKRKLGSPACDLELRNLILHQTTIIPKRISATIWAKCCFQSITCGTPVIITKTQGFWDKENFHDGVNIFLIKATLLNLKKMFLKFIK